MSFGYMTCRSDVEALIILVSDFFVELALPAADMSHHSNVASATGCQAHHASHSSDATTVSRAPVSCHKRSSPQRQTSLAASQAACSDTDSAAHCVSLFSASEPADERRRKLCESAQTLSQAGLQMTEVPTCLADDLTACEHHAESAPSSEVAVCGDDEKGHGLRVVGMWVFPVKSAAGMQVDSWPLGANGLLYDRYTSGSSPLPEKRVLHRWLTS